MDPELGLIVTRIFDWYATGLYSLKDVAAKARDAGMRYRKSGRPIGVSTVHHMLRTRLYSGLFDWRGEVYHGVHAPLVSPDTWDAVQKILDGRSTTNVRAKPHRFPFTGLIKCGHCGCALVAQIQKGKYIYYRCSGFRGKCPERFVRQEVLEEKFIGLLKTLWCDPQQFQAIRSRLAGAIPPATLTEGVTPLWRQMPVSNTSGALLNDGLALLDMGRTAHLLFAGLPDEMKKHVLSLIFQQCLWAHGKLTGSFTTPFEIFAHCLVEKGTERALPTIELSDLLWHVQPEVRLLIARYNAMRRIAVGSADYSFTLTSGSPPALTRLAA